jgi:hypothetical protein
MEDNLERMNMRESFPEYGKKSPDEISRYYLYKTFGLLIIRHTESLPSLGMVSKSSYNSTGGKQQKKIRIPSREPFLHQANNIKKK